MMLYGMQLGDALWLDSRSHKHVPVALGSWIHDVSPRVTTCSVAWQKV